MRAMRDSTQFIVAAFSLTNLTFILFPPVLTTAQSIAPDNLISTAQITFKLCYFPGVKSERVAWKFFACYDQAPGKQLFVKCQKSTFNGVLFNSVRNIKSNCRNPLTIPTYARCLGRVFRKAGIDMNVAVRKLNACQLPILS